MLFFVLSSSEDSDDKLSKSKNDSAGKSGLFSGLVEDVGSGSL